MTRVRLELESLRILMQRINKREKLKRDGELFASNLSCCTGESPYTFMADCAKAT